jgi:hypothetical protein
MANYSLEKIVKFEDLDFQGSKIRVPIVYSNQFRIAANFTVSLPQAKMLLPSRRLEPIEVKPGVGILSITAFEYKAIHGLKPYNEFGTFLPVNYRRVDGTLGEPGVYCLHLPVTTERARWGGVAIYGFPKFVAEIEFTHEKDATSCNVWHDGKTVAELVVEKVEPKRALNRLICYTYKEGFVLKTLVEAEGLVGTSKSVGGAKITLGTHKIADELRKLGVREEAVEYQYIPQMYSLLHTPSEHLIA